MRAFICSIGPYRIAIPMDAVASLGNLSEMGIGAQSSAVARGGKGGGACVSLPLLLGVPPEDLRHGITLKGAAPLAGGERLAADGDGPGSEGIAECGAGEAAAGTEAGSAGNDGGRLAADGDGPGSEGMAEGGAGEAAAGAEAGGACDDGQRLAADDDGADDEGMAECGAGEAAAGAEAGGACDDGGRLAADDDGSGGEDMAESGAGEAAACIEAGGSGADGGRLAADYDGAKGEGMAESGAAAGSQGAGAAPAENGAEAAPAGMGPAKGGTILLSTEVASAESMPEGEIFPVPGALAETGFGRLFSGIRCAGGEQGILLVLDPERMIRFARGEEAGFQL